MDNQLPDNPASAEASSQEAPAKVLPAPEDQSPQADNAGAADTQRAHLQHVSNQALILFDRTRPLHGMNEDVRFILEQAVHLQGQHIPRSRKKPYRAALAWVREQVPAELSPDDQNTLAAVLVYNQGKIKKKHFDRLKLTPIQQRQVLTIAAILRIAVGLDDSLSQATTIRQVEPARDGMWIVVDGPQAISDAAVAQNKARLWAAIGYPEVTVMESAEAATRILPYPEATETIGILPGDSLAEAGRKVMRFHFAQMLRHEEGTRLGEDIEALHDMRVATRRLRAAFEVFREAFEPGALKPHLKGLRATGRALGSVRDLDVFMEKAHNYIKTLPESERSGLDPLLETWQKRRESARAEMLKLMDSPEYLSFKRNFNVFLATPGAGVLETPLEQPAPGLVRELAPVLIYQRLAGVRAFEPFLHDAPIETLHALRIEFKKLRYTVEYFREVLGRQSREVIEEFKTIQDHLGDLNDAQVATLILAEFIDLWEPQQSQLPIHERRNIEAVVSYLASRHAERHRLMASFEEVWKHFNRASFRRNLASAVAAL